jgi:hypothetical protein
MNAPSAEAIARAVLESHAAAFYVLAPTQFEAREKVIASAAQAIAPVIDAMLREHAEAVCTANAT